VSEKGKESPEMLFQIFFDPQEWDDATWSGTVFINDLSHMEPPIPGLGIGFADFETGKKIFDGWIKRLGHVDEYDELRVSIIEGPLPSERDGYTVVLSSNPLNTIKRKQQWLLAYIE
jgi:hypothetical protein